MHIIVLLMIVGALIGIPLGIGKHTGKLFLGCVIFVVLAVLYCYMNPVVG